MSTGLWSNWESTSIDLWGPRRGKTSSRIIPAICAHPGPVVATSNRRDVVDATRGVRAAAGPVRVFDPQDLVGERPGWFWDMRSYITGDPRPEVAAQRLAGLLADATFPPDTTGDRFFDPKGTALLGRLLHAAAAAGRPLTDVYGWVTAENDDTPAQLLHAAGYPLSAAAVRAAIHAPSDTAGGIWATAEQPVAWLTVQAAVDWVTPRPGARPFDPDTFAAGTGTLYLLSREGRGSMAPLTTALTAAVLEAAERRATASPGGRLPVPLLAALDEVANVCRWGDLPARYSHWGGRGIIPMAVLQSWAQGEQAWGPRGMAMLWSAANVRVYGGGVAEVGFLRELSELAGSYWRPQMSTSVTRGVRTTNHSLTEERVLDVADLGGLDPGRVLVFAGLPRPVLARPVPWWSGPHAAAIRASIARYDPGAADTLAAVNAAAAVPWDATAERDAELAARWGAGPR